MRKATILLKKIQFNNYLIFEGDQNFTFGEINFIKGPNGVGKSTLTLYSILFCLYGYSQKKLLDLPTKSIDTSNLTSVTLYLVQNDAPYIITRSVPTNLKIVKNGVEVEKANNQLKQQYINEVFGDLQYFRKFRTIDKDEGINVIDEGNVSLKKTLFSIYEDLFNKVKDNLLETKRDRELFNKDRLHVDTHYPSLKRLALLENRIKLIDLEINKISHVIANSSTYKSKLDKRHGIALGNQFSYERTLKLLEENSVCPYCFKSLSKEELEQKIQETNTNLININKDIEVNIEIIESLDKQNDLDSAYFSSLYEQKEKINSLIFKLSNRIKQKEFKYSEKDVLITKKALVELDTFTSYFIIKSIQTLEPIINTILEHIRFEIKFIVNDKNNIDYTLSKDGIKYTKEDLSSGQKLILQIAFKLALLMQRGESGLVIADEGMSSLDSSNLLHIIDLIKGLPFQLLIVLHNVDKMPEYVNIIELGG